MSHINKYWEVSVKGSLVEAQIRQQRRPTAAE